MDFTYDKGLVALSIAVAILGSFTGLVMTTGIGRVRGPEVVLRLLLGGAGVGGGIWSMHFIAMLAVVLPIPLGYDIPETAASAAVAVTFTSVALWIVSKRKFGRLTLPLSALFLGLGIASMHYMGMYAIRGCGTQYDATGVAFSILIAIQASAVALWFAFRERGVLSTFLGSVVLGLAIAAMHYSGMEATSFVRSTASLRPRPEAQRTLTRSYDCHNALQRVQPLPDRFRRTHLRAAAGPVLALNQPELN